MDIASLMRAIVHIIRTHEENNIHFSSESYASPVQININEKSMPHAAVFPTNINADSNSSAGRLQKVNFTVQVTTDGRTDPESHESLLDFSKYQKFLLNALVGMKTTKHTLQDGTVLQIINPIKFDGASAPKFAKAGGSEYYITWDFLFSNYIFIKDTD